MMKMLCCFKNGRLSQKIASSAYKNDIDVLNLSKVTNINTIRKHIEGKQVLVNELDYDIIEMFKKNSIPFTILRNRIKESWKYDFDYENSLIPQYEFNLKILTEEIVKQCTYYDICYDGTIQEKNGYFSESSSCANTYLGALKKAVKILEDRVVEHTTKAKKSEALLEDYRNKIMNEEINNESK